MTTTPGSSLRPSRALRRWHAHWLTELDHCLDFATRPGAFETRAPEVSGWSVGQQLEHVVLSDRRILDGLERISREAGSGEAAVAGGPTLVGRFILASGFIPRGRAQAPEAVVPSGMEPDELSAALDEVWARVEALTAVLGALEAVRHTRHHPILGRFTPRQWIRFSGVHHRHHRKIIQDILRVR